MKNEILVTAIKGLDGPNYNIMDKYTKLGLGNYVGGMVDTWKWNSLDTMNRILKDYNELQLISMYDEIKNSWK